MDRPIDRLLAVMARLRDPQTGCPWDVKQSFATIAPYTIEEAYEVADAIERNDMSALKDELGDLLFQVVFHAQMAAEAKAFTFADVVEAISQKMLRRHPHVFGEADVKTAEAQTIAWEEHKKRERAARPFRIRADFDDSTRTIHKPRRRRGWASWRMSLAASSFRGRACRGPAPNLLGRARSASPSCSKREPVAPRA